MRQRKTISVIRRSDSRWYTVVIYVGGERTRISGRGYGLDSEKYTPDEAARIVADALNVPLEGQHSPKGDVNALGGLYDWFLPRLTMEGLSAKTIKEYRIALSHLQTILGAAFPTTEVTKSHGCR